MESKKNVELVVYLPIHNAIHTYQALSFHLAVVMPEAVANRFRACISIVVSDSVLSPS